MAAASLSCHSAGRTDFPEASRINCSVAAWTDRNSKTHFIFEDRGEVTHWEESESWAGQARWGHFPKCSLRTLL